MIRDGLLHFRSLQHLTICRCRVRGRGFQQVAAQVALHLQLRTLRIIKVEMDVQAAGRRGSGVRDVQAAGRRGSGVRGVQAAGWRGGGGRELDTRGCF